MDFLEISGGVLVLVALVLVTLSIFIPRAKILKVDIKANPPAISRRIMPLKPIHSIPFWMLNSLGKTFRISMDTSALVGLLLIGISYWGS